MPILLGSTTSDASQGNVGQRDPIGNNLPATDSWIGKGRALVSDRVFNNVIVVALYARAVERAGGVRRNIYPCDSAAL